MANRDIRSLDVGMLRAFEALALERSVSRAAARLFLTQPAVSAALHRFRDTFGDPLFTRTAHGMEPTARALALAPLVDKVLADIATLLEADQPFDPAASDRIFRIAGSDHASHLLLPELSRRGGRTGRLDIPTEAQAERELSDGAALGARLIASCEPDFPHLLAALDPPPPLIWTRGNWPSA